jgi:hypothetical protein
MRSRNWKPKSNGGQNCAKGVSWMEEEKCFGTDGTPKGLHELLPKKLDPMHMQGSRVDLIGPICMYILRHRQGKICSKIAHEEPKITHIKGHGLVDGSPPDIAFGRGFLDDTLIGRGTTSLSTRVGAQSTARGDSTASFVDESIFVEGRNGGVGNLEDVRQRKKNHCGNYNQVSSKGGVVSYNCYTVVVNVSSLVELLLKLGVTLARPERQLVTISIRRRGRRVTY